MNNIKSLEFSVLKYFKKIFLIKQSNSNSIQENWVKTYLCKTKQTTQVYFRKTVIETNLLHKILFPKF